MALLQLKVLNNNNEDKIALVNKVCENKVKMI